ncbi:hypothetical protein PPACK8108_LOCUS15492 [Phakopsora pachyrhizi]|uniref:Uncharacterized protein n=1 Tax=Phakopsora pachyrhizi TaxID=170000 RepID=A0AAV0B9W2_PHAPC|nr:hypothetical protein PPACK8108_LOCUS15492 [Phakopsora pachyrhizi]
MVFQTIEQSKQQIKKLKKQLAFGLGNATNGNSFGGSFHLDTSRSQMTELGQSIHLIGFIGLLQRD